MADLGLGLGLVGGSILIAVVGMRLGILLGRRLDRAVTRDDEEGE